MSFYVSPWPIKIKFFWENLTNISFFNFFEPFLKNLSVSNAWTSLNHFNKFVIILTLFIFLIMVYQILKTLYILIFTTFGFLIINKFYEWFKSNKWFYPRFKCIINISMILFKAAQIEWIWNFYFVINF